MDKSKERWIGGERESARGVKGRRWEKIRTVGKCKKGGEEVEENDRCTLLSDELIEK